MAFKQVTCVVLTCDRCDNGWDEDGSPHFESVEDLVEYAVGVCRFKITRDDAGTIEAALCEDCIKTLECERDGCQYPVNEWHSTERAGVEVRFRYCEHCGQTDYEPTCLAKLAVLNATAEILDQAHKEIANP
jgi:hypothetical protein